MLFTMDLIYMTLYLYEIKKRNIKTSKESKIWLTIPTYMKQHQVKELVIVHHAYVILKIILYLLI